MSKLLPSSERLSLKPYYCVSLSLTVRKMRGMKRIPMIKLGLMYLDTKKLSNTKDNMYINLVIKPSIPKAK